ncbi:hypothetical protein [Curtobacterium sp. ISL-83]|uniref:hypothetical protein n=1 Tax=Curtobacterium sp. ISL-83 TaxID=2819145 RepID=UPI001BEC2BE8|nr:hypothetical protein [Curtobacterium sp. ISL-83]MBT2503822.1 hypothetical protein [Curtobacterium sp. ISL-83]
METQSGARTPLVDPFGRELEEWLRDAPATRAPYLADLVVPPVTGPVQRPDADVVAGPALVAAPVVAAPSVVETAVEDAAVDAPAAARSDAAAPSDDTAFRRPRDRARHAALCAPSFPEPPERLALQIEDLAVLVSAATGRPTIDRIVLLEDEVLRRDEDLARLAAWEATVAEIDDPEVVAARSFARTVFADLLADAADEADRRERAAARRAATGSIAIAPVPAPRTAHVGRRAAEVDRADAVVESTTAVEPTTAVVANPAVVATTGRRDEPVRPVQGLQAVTPVSANTRPAPLVQPATGPTVIDRAAFAAALTAHEGRTASTPVVLPAAVAMPTLAGAPEAANAADTSTDAQVTASTEDAADVRTAGWWARLVDRILRAVGRR